MLISHKGHTDTIQVYSVTVMTHVKALQTGHSSQGTSESITPAITSGRAGCYEMLITFEEQPRKLLAAHNNRCPRLLYYVMHTIFCTFSDILNIDDVI